MGGLQAPINLTIPPKPTVTPKPPPQPKTTSTSKRCFLLSLPLLWAQRWAHAESYDPLTQAEKDSSRALSKRVTEALELLEKGREFQAQGDFNKALEYFTLVVENFKDLGLCEYARVGRALALYEVGNRDEAIAEMEDVSISLKGYPEVHAALAAALYVDKHAPLLAENQFTIATLLDPHYTDLSYVKEIKHWPPSLVSSLEHFITLS